MSIEFEATKVGDYGESHGFTNDRAGRNGQSGYSAQREHQVQDGLSGRESKLGAGVNVNTIAVDAKDVDVERIERAVREILSAVGEDPQREGLLETPRRVAKMYAEMFSGLRSDPARHLQVLFPEAYDEMVLVRDIPFASMCEHHLLPFTGVAHVAYIPNGHVTGLSKLARVVDEVARRPQVQERLTHTVADLLETELGTAGAAVVIEAEHSCMSIRGVRKPGSSTTTSAMRGAFRSNASSRAEVLALINQRRS